MRVEQVACDKTQAMDSFARARDAFAHADSNAAPWVRFFHEANLDALSGVVNATQPGPTFRVGDVVAQRSGHPCSLPVQPVAQGRGAAAGRVGTAHLR